MIRRATPADVPAIAAVQARAWLHAFADIVEPERLPTVEDQVLADKALERRRLLVELAAGAPRLRSLQHSLLALRRQAIEADNQFDQRVEQRQADQQEAEQDELEE